MGKILTGVLLLIFPVVSYGQQFQIERFLSDSSMIHSSVSMCILDAETGSTIFQYNPGKSLMQASILKLITTAAALEMLGKDYTFKTIVGYSGKIRKGSKTLHGNIIIKGGGDPRVRKEKGKGKSTGYQKGFGQDRC